MLLFLALKKLRHSDDIEDEIDEMQVTLNKLKSLNHSYLISTYPGKIVDNSNNL